ncbi:MAG: nitronate monooxygenase, partial [Rhodocyclaceae bacterium]|nr:nitronate monooxygenase [Rhodocyclaceae bacterium]
GVGGIGRIAKTREVVEALYGEYAACLEREIAEAEGLRRRYPVRPN